MTGIPSATPLTGAEWLTWTFSGTDVLTLAPATSYAVAVFSSQSYYGFDAALNPATYPGGFAFNSTGAARQFTSTTAQNRGYDRTFHADLVAVPEPATCFAFAGGVVFVGLIRRRR